MTMQHGTKYSLFWQCGDYAGRGVWSGVNAHSDCPGVADTVGPHGGHWLCTCTCHAPRWAHLYGRVAVPQAN